MPHFNLLLFYYSELLSFLLCQLCSVREIFTGTQLWYIIQHTNDLGLVLKIAYWLAIIVINSQTETVVNSTSIPRRYVASDVDAYNSIDHGRDMALVDSHHNPTKPIFFQTLGPSEHEFNW